MSLIYKKNEINIESLISDEKFKQIINFCIKKYGYYLDFEDATQESYICLLKTAKTFKTGTCSFQTYYSNCLKNHLLSLNIKEITRTKKLSKRKIEPVYYSLAPYIDYSIKQLDDINNLRTGEKQLLFDYYFNKKTLKEIANQVGVSIQCVQKKISDLLERISKNHQLSSLQT